MGVRISPVFGCNQRSFCLHHRRRIDEKTFTASSSHTKNRRHTPAHGFFVSLFHLRERISMRVRALVAGSILLVFLLIVVFFTSFEKGAERGLSSSITGYSCAENGVCGTCFFQGEKCSCDDSSCLCGNRTLSNDVCTL